MSMEPEQKSQKRQPRRRRDARLFVTLTEREKKAIIDAADVDGVGPTEWARGRLLEQAFRLLRGAKRANRRSAISREMNDETSEHPDMLGHLP